MNGEEGKGKGEWRERGEREGSIERERGREGGKKGIWWMKSVEGVEEREEGRTEWMKEMEEMENKRK